MFHEMELRHASLPFAAIDQILVQAADAGMHRLALYMHWRAVTRQSASHRLELSADMLHVQLDCHAESILIHEEADILITGTLPVSR